MLKKKKSSYTTIKGKTVLMCVGCLSFSLTEGKFSSNPKREKV